MRQCVVRERKIPMSSLHAYNVMNELISDGDRGKENL